MSAIYVEQGNYFYFVFNKIYFPIKFAYAFNKILFLQHLKLPQVFVCQCDTQNKEITYEKID